MNVNKADDLSIRKKIFQFRYNIYIEEYDKHFLNPDYNQKMLTDCMDENSILFYSKKREKINGTIRLNVIQDSKDVGKMI